MLFNFNKSIYSLTDNIFMTQPNQKQELPALEIESVKQNVLEDESNYKHEIELNKQKTQSSIDKYKNLFLSVLTASIFISLIALSWNYDQQNDNLINFIYEDNSIENGEKVEIISKLNDKYFDKISPLFLP